MKMLEMKNISEINSFKVGLMGYSGGKNQWTW